MGCLLLCVCLRSAAGTRATGGQFPSVEPRARFWMCRDCGCWMLDDFCSGQRIASSPCGDLFSEGCVPQRVCAGTVEWAWATGISAVGLALQHEDYHAGFCPSTSSSGIFRARWMALMRTEAAEAFAGALSHPSTAAKAVLDECGGKGRLQWTGLILAVRLCLFMAVVFAAAEELQDCCCV